MVCARPYPQSVGMSSTVRAASAFACKSNRTYDSWETAYHRGLPRIMQQNPVGSYFTGHGIAGKSTVFEGLTIWSAGDTR